MIRVDIKRDDQNNIVEYKVTGHAGYDKRGRDIVCSAVSVLVQASIIGLTKVANVKVEYSTGDGKLHCIIPPLEQRSRREANLLLDTMFYALEDISENYPGNVVISEMEV